MIVKDKNKTLNKSYEISDKVFNLMKKEAIEFHSDDNDPAEHVYLFLHVLARINSLMLLTLEGYGKTYAIEKMTIDYAKECVDEIVKEYLKVYKEKNNEN